MPIRAWLVAAEGGGFRLFRQPQWMAEVRRDPAAAARPRRALDIDEPTYAEALRVVGRLDLGAGLDDARAALERLGARPIGGP